MNKKKPLIISIAIHIILFIVILLYKPYNEDESTNNKVNIELVFKKDKKYIESKAIIDKNVDIVDKSRPIEANVTIPIKESYIATLTDSPVPDLILMENPELDNSIKTSLVFNTANFEDSLSNLIDIEIMEPADEKVSDELSITWNGDSRDILRNSTIDFSSFPRDSFTGVGVHVEFMVNHRGEVFDVKVLPPGSGSIEFDILIGQYVGKFTFKEGETINRGEVFIVYKK